MADALATLDGDGAVVTKPPCGEGISGESLAEWLAERVYEVERAIGRLPSIALLADGDDLIDPPMVATRHILARYNTPIVACEKAGS